MFCRILDLRKCTYYRTTIHSYEMTYSVCLCIRIYEVISECICEVYTHLDIFIKTAVYLHRITLLYKTLFKFYYTNTLIVLYVKCTFFVSLTTVCLISCWYMFATQRYIELEESLKDGETPVKKAVMSILKYEKYKFNIKTK